MARPGLHPPRPAEDGDHLPADHPLGLPRAAAGRWPAAARRRAARPPVGLPGGPRGRRTSSKHPELHRTAWARLRTALGEWDGDGLVSHEFFAAASPTPGRRHDRRPRTGRGARGRDRARAAGAVHRQLAGEPEEPQHRAAARLRPHRLQEPQRDLELAHPRPAAGAATLGPRPAAGAGARAAPATAVVRARPSGTPSPAWSASTPTAYDTEQSFPNESMGVVEAETLRRINEHLGSFERAFDRGVYIRTFLADERLVPRGGDRYWPEPDQVEECRRRGRAGRRVRARARLRRPRRPR